MGALRVPEISCMLNLNKFSITSPTLGLRVSLDMACQHLKLCLIIPLGVTPATWDSFIEIQHTIGFQSPGVLPMGSPETIVLVIDKTSENKLKPIKNQILTLI